MDKCKGYCGFDCTKCPAYIALKTNDDTLRIKTAGEWTKKYHHNFTKDMINCTGCTSKKGPQCGYCSMCTVRVCVQKHNMDRCINCGDFDSCKIVKDFERQSEFKLNMFLCFVIFSIFFCNCTNQQDIVITSTQNDLTTTHTNLLQKKNLEEQLFFAISWSDVETVKKLITQGVDVNACKNDQSAIERAVERALGCFWGGVKPVNLKDNYFHFLNWKSTDHFIESRDILCLLIEAGASFDEDDVLLIENMAASGDVVLTDLLLKKGLNFKCKKFLVYAANSGNYEAFKLVLAKYSDISIQLDGEGNSALTAAVCGYGKKDAPSNIEIVRSLLDRGADVNHKNKCGESVLAIAARDTNEGVVKLLLQQGADINSKTNDNLIEKALCGLEYLCGGASVLMYAVLGNNENMVSFLLDQSLDLEEKDVVGQAALHWAAGSKDFSRDSVLRLLLKKGANVNSVDKEGRTPLMNNIINRNSDIRIIVSLIKSGADILIKDNYGKTAMDYFHTAGVSDLYDWLRVRDVLMYPKKAALILEENNFEDLTRFESQEDYNFGVYGSESSFPCGVTVKRKLFKTSDKILIFYPAISSSGLYQHLSGFRDIKTQDEINKKLKASFTKWYTSQRKPNKNKLYYGCNFEAWLISNLIIIMKKEITSSGKIGIAKDKQKSFFIDAASGKFYKPLELFKKDSNFVSKIAKLVCGGNDKNEKFFKLKNNFIATKKGIEIYFDRDISARLGKRVFKIKYEDIDELIDKDGAIYKALNANICKQDKDMQQGKTEKKHVQPNPNILHKDLIFNGDPLDVGVIEAMVEGDSSRFEPKKIADCRNTKDEEILDDSALSNPGYFGYSYHWKDLEIGLRDTNYCFWKYLGTFENTKTHIIEADYGGYSGTGCFSSIFLLERDGDVVRNVGEVAGGDRGSGGIEHAFFANNMIFFEQRATHLEFFVSCVDVLASDDRTVVHNSSESANEFVIYKGIKIPCSYMDLPICCVDWVGTVKSRWKNKVQEFISAKLGCGNDSDYDDDIDDNELYEAYFDCNRSGSLLRKCFNLVVEKYSKRSKRNLNRDGMKKFAQEVLNLYVQNKDK